MKVGKRFKKRPAIRYTDPVSIATWNAGNPGGRDSIVEDFLRKKIVILRQSHY